MGSQSSAMNWKDRLRRELEFVYGAPEGPKLAETLIKLAESQRVENFHQDFNNPSEVILITYGDQVQRDGEPPLATLRYFLRNHIKDLVDGVHLLPFYPWSSDDGFSVMDFFAVDPSLGTWEDIRALGSDFRLMFDGVFNHASAKGVWFAKFLNEEPGYRDFFTTVEGSPDLSKVVRPRALPLLTEFQTKEGLRRVWTTFSADQADLNFRDPFVMRSLCEALLFYLRQGARLVRLDAIGFIWKETGTSCIHLPQAHALVRAWRAIVDGAAPGARLVTETNVPHADNISYFGDGSNEAHMVYNFALPPLVLHTLRSGSAVAINRWASNLETPSQETAFFNFLASHDGIGLNPARGILEESEINALVAAVREGGGFVSMKALPGGGEAPYELNMNFLDALAVGTDFDTAVARFLCAHAIAFALAGIPGIYFHSLFGSRGDVKGAQISGIPRRINREKFELHNLEEELGRPDSLRSQIFQGLASLLRARKSLSALAPASPQWIEDFGTGVVAIRRGSESNPVICLHEISGVPVEFPLDGSWRDAISGCIHTDSVKLPRLGIAWLSRVS